MATEEKKYYNLNAHAVTGYFMAQGRFEGEPPTVEEAKEPFILKVDGTTITCFSNKTIQLLGGDSESIAEELRALDTHLATKPKIFVDYAFKAKSKKDTVVTLLKAWGFEPLVMEENANQSHFLLSKLEKLIVQADYGLVLLTADDRLQGGGYHPRPNVMLELGMLLNQLRDKGDKRLSIINYAVKKLDIPSDILGLAYTTYNKKTFEKDLFNELIHLYGSVKS